MVQRSADADRQVSSPESFVNAPPPTVNAVGRFGHGSAELENSLYVVGGHTAIAGVFPASPSVSLKQVRRFKRGGATPLLMFPPTNATFLRCRWSVTTPSGTSGS